MVPKPIVCAINGSCAGLGLVTALVCDIRFAADDAKITTAFARRGLPAEEAVSWMLPRIVGHAVALDLLLSGRIVLGAEAAALGLVHRALPRDELLPGAREYAPRPRRPLFAPRHGHRQAPGVPGLGALARRQPPRGHAASWAC